MLELDTIITGDCLPILRGMDSKSVDLVFTSPPYNCGIKYDGYSDNLRWEDYLLWCQEWINECYRILKDDGRIGINVLIEMGVEDNKRRVNPQVSFSNMMSNAGFNQMGTALWQETHRVKYTAWGSWMSASAPYIYNSLEVILLGYKLTRKKVDKGISTISKDDFINGVCGLWKIKPETKSLTAACFPVALPKLVIDLLTYKGDTVCDPFLGSGTTAVACIQTGRHYLGIEQSPEYVAIAERRIKNTFFQEGMFDTDNEEVPEQKKVLSLEQGGMF